MATRLNRRAFLSRVGWISGGALLGFSTSDYSVATIFNTMTGERRRASGPNVDVMPALGPNTDIMTRSPNYISIPVPQSLDGKLLTIFHALMHRPARIQSFRTTARFDWVPNADAVRFSPTWETDELSIWAGQPELGYYRDVEWGLLARLFTDHVALFLQLGDGQVLTFHEVPLHPRDGRDHEYLVRLTATNVGLITLVSVEGHVDGQLKAQVVRPTLLRIPENYGMVVKSHRVSPDNIDLSGTLTVTALGVFPGDS
jgi:hypothetical protein